MEAAPLGWVNWLLRAKFGSNRMHGKGPSQTFRQISGYAWPMVIRGKSTYLAHERIEAFAGLPVQRRWHSLEAHPRHIFPGGEPG